MAAAVSWLAFAHATGIVVNPCLNPYYASTDMVPLFSRCNTSALISWATAQGKCPLISRQGVPRRCLGTCAQQLACHQAVCLDRQDAELDLVSDARRVAGTRRADVVQEGDVAAEGRPKPKAAQAR